METDIKSELDQELNNAIDRWLVERQQLLSLYIDLPQMSIGGDVLAAVHRLCEALVDYTSHGHFQVYEQLLLVITNRDEARAAPLRQLLAKINATTDRILVFDDEYGDVEKLSIQDVGHFTKRLSKLGEDLTSRFNYEDDFMALYDGVFISQNSHN